MVETDLLRIGQLAKLANVTPRTIRFYIQEGLLPKPVRIHKTMALYSRDCIDKITAIKTAQNAHFLPLMVIRNILEQNEYDYSSLEKNISQIEKEKKPVSSTGSKDVEGGLSLDSVNSELSISPDVVKQMANQEWITLNEKGNKKWIETSDFEFLEKISILQQNGVSLEEQMRFFNSMQDIIEKGVELELETLIKLLVKNPNKNFPQSLEIERKTVQKFIGKIRERSLQQYFKAYAEIMDNSYRASVDEGFALPAEEIMEDIQTLESSINGKFPDVQKLIWLSTGYSCIGDLKHSLEVLHKALKIAPDNLEAKVKMIWYKRFTKKRQDVKRLKSRLIEIVRINPTHTLGHVFLVDWCVLDALASENATGKLEGMKLCLDEIRKMEATNPQNPHEWALVQYSKGRVYTALPLFGSDYIEEGILSFEEILNHRKELDEYYAASMPFFPKWIWPNLLYILGTSYLQVRKFKEATSVFKMAKTFNVAFPFQERLEKGIIDANNGISVKQ